jgi:hypothetical protein
VTWVESGFDSLAAACEILFPWQQPQEDLLEIATCYLDTIWKEALDIPLKICTIDFSAFSSSNSAFALL